MLLKCLKMIYAHQKKEVGRSETNNTEEVEKAIMAVIFYGLPIGGGNWIASESVWKKDGKVFLFINDEWIEVNPASSFCITR